MIVEFLQVSASGDPVLDSLVAALEDDLPALMAEVAEAAADALHDIDEGDGLFVSGVGRALAEPLERGTQSGT